MPKKLKVTLVRSLSGRIQKHRDTVRALGFRRLHQSVVHNDTPQVRGMIDSVRFMVKVEEVHG